jgi:hypothetical protein
MSEGPCAWHRRSFAPVRALLSGEQLSFDLELDGAFLTEEEIDLAD